MNLGDYRIADTLAFSVQTKNSVGTPTDADSAPAYRVYEDTTGTAIATGTMTLTDASNTNGFYTASLSLLAATGYEVGKEYTIRISATVGGITGAALRYFRVTSRTASVVSVTGYPDDDDLTTRLTDAGITAPSTTTLVLILNQVVGMWEKLTGYKPFLNASSTVTTRVYDPPGPQGARHFRNMGGGRLLNLRAGLLSLTSVEVGGVAYTSGTNVFLRPNNAIAEERPYTELEFLGEIWGNPQSVSVQGVFGYCTELPEAVFEAILQEAFARACIFAELKLTGGLQSWSENDVTENYGKNPLLSSTAPLTGYFQTALDVYRLAELF